MIRRHHPNAGLELWAQDEARLGLVPIVKRIWAEKGKRPLAIHHRRYEWLYVYGFVQPTTGRVEWLLLPSVDTALFQLALDRFAATVGAGPNKHIVLVLDGAGWHRAKELKVPIGIHMFPLPPYSPELQPAEHLWPLVHEAVANENIANIDELDDAVSRRCRYLHRDHELIHSNTLFSWWAHAAEVENLIA
jgi:hypothetical protein